MTHTLTTTINIRLVGIISMGHPWDTVTVKWGHHFRDADDGGGQGARVGVQDCATLFGTSRGGPLRLCLPQLFVTRPPRCTQWWTRRGHLSDRVIKIHTPIPLAASLSCGWRTWRNFFQSYCGCYRLYLPIRPWWRCSRYNSELPFSIVLINFSQDLCLKNPAVKLVTVTAFC